MSKGTETTSEQYTQELIHENRRLRAIIAGISAAKLGKGALVDIQRVGGENGMATTRIVVCRADSDEREFALNVHRTMTGVANAYLAARGDRVEKATPADVESQGSTRTSRFDGTPLPEAQPPAESAPAERPVKLIKDCMSDQMVVLGDSESERWVAERANNVGPGRYRAVHPVVLKQHADALLESILFEAGVSLSRADAVPQNEVDDLQSALNVCVDSMQTYLPDTFDVLVPE